MQGISCWPHAAGVLILEYTAFPDTPFILTQRGVYSTLSGDPAELCCGSWLAIVTAMKPHQAASYPDKAHQL